MASYFCEELFFAFCEARQSCENYCIAQMFGRVKPWWFQGITGGSPYFTIQILIMSCDINKESKQAGIHQRFTGQNFLIRNSPKFTAPNIHTTDSNSHENF